MVPERVKVLRDAPRRRGGFVLYWMQASQRAESNHALACAVAEANAANEPVVVLFGLTDRFPEANARHYRFLLEGLRETGAALERRGIRMIVRRESPERAAVALSREASLLVADRGYLRIQRAWRRHVAEHAACPVLQVESDAVVPVDVASPKEEYAAATLRPKIRRHLRRFLVPFRDARVRRDSLSLNPGGESLADVESLLSRLQVDRSVGPAAFRGGTPEARRRLRRFLRERLDRYADERSDPSLNIASDLSPYLHFGQISPLEVALAVENARDTNRAARDAFLEELIVRRELSLNFVEHNPRYDAFDCLPAWAQRSLREHAADPREYSYRLEVLEEARTHDPYWNAAQREMVLTGKMHNYMRMYWGKKILEWSPTPEAAFTAALHLNNKYELDGRDPNGFAGVAWCFGKHDRAWGEREVFGKIRYMGEAGLKRKFDMNTYVRRVDRAGGNAKRGARKAE